MFSRLRGDLFTTWKEGDFDLKYHDKVSTSRETSFTVGIHGDNKS